MINITFGIIGNYCCFKNIVYNGSYATNFSVNYDPSIVTMEGNSGWTYLPDMAVIAAVNRINESPHILPGVHVNLKRFTDCGHYDPSANFEYAGNSGGYASAVTGHDIIDVHKDVVAIVGNQYSSAAKGLNEILSTNKIPVCMASTASPRFSDRNLYPFVFRTITNHYAKGTLLLLKKWKVTRVAVIYQNDDDFGRWEWKAVRKGCTTAGIRIEASIGVQTNFGDATAEWVHQTLLQVDARYIIITGQSNFIDNTIAAVAGLGILGERYVWITNNLVQTNPKAFTYLNGLIIGKTVVNQTTQTLVEDISAQAQYDFGADFLYYVDDYSLASFFDCTMLLALGLSKIANHDNEKLARRGFQDEMNFTLFQNLEYAGISAPGLVTFDSFGDRQSRIDFQSFTGDYMNRTTFAISSDDDSSIVEYNETAPVFFGGAIVPPPDGSLTVKTTYYSMASVEGIILFSLAVLGVGAGIFCIIILVYNRQEKLIKSASPLDMIIFSIASVLVYTFSFFNLGIPTALTCKARVATLSTGMSFLLPALIIKNAMLAWLFHQNRRLQKKSIDQMWKRMRLLVYGPVWIAACAFLAWTYNVSIRPVQLLHHDIAYFRCQMNRGNSQFLMVQLVFNGLVLLLLFVTAFFTSRIQNADLNETSKIWFVAVSVIAGFCLVQILSQSPDSMTDFKTAIIVWVVNTFILFTVMGLPIIQLYQSRKYLKRKQRNRNNESSSLFGTSIQTRIHRETTRNVVSKYNYIQLNKTRIRCIFKIQNRMTFASPWFTATASLHSCGDQKTWFALTNPTTAWCFPISESRGFMVHGATAILDLKLFDINQTLVLEFADAVESRGFVVECRLAVGVIQKCNDDI
ncbi:periplasmic binding protein-like I [Chytriomyces cf. hyalinus JEL632]|nr:periplasmic binding protein-like I [Chytriomyces cf. hyalinus JEL632]